MLLSCIKAQLEHNQLASYIHISNALLDSYEEEPSLLQVATFVTIESIFIFSTVCA